MPDRADMTPLDPTIRFRLRTILGATTVLAIAAAIAAPYWRRQAPAIQTALFAYWTVVLTFGAFAAWMNWKQAWRLPEGAGQIACVGWATGRRRWHAAGSPLVMILSLVGLFAMVATQSTVIAGRGQSLTLGGIPFSSLAMGASHGFMLGGIVLYLLRRPLYLSENGVYGAMNAPWKYIRHAEWVADRPGIMKLRRLDGDIYLDVPKDVHDATETFVRGKTRFVEDGGLVPE